MDITSLANEAIGYLAPAMPFLLAHQAKRWRAKRLKKSADFGEESFKYGKSLWSKLWRESRSQTSALETAKDLAAIPNDVDNQASFRKELKKIFGDDDALAAEIKQILERPKPQASRRPTRRNTNMATTHITNRKSRAFRVQTSAAVQ